MQPKPYSRFHRRLPGRATLPASILRTTISIVLALSLFLSQWDLPAFAFPLPVRNKTQAADPILKRLPITELTTDEAIYHALNRLAYGPRPGDLERIKQMGLAKWIDQQLNPGSISDSAVESRLNVYPTLRMSSAQLIAEYPNPKQAARQAGLSKQEFRAQQVAQKQSDATSTVGMSSHQDKGSSTSESSQAAMTASTDSPSPMKLNPATAGPVGKDALSADPNAVPRGISDDSRRPQRVVEELAMAKVTRAIYSERQLQQVMDDFWFNHFNVYAGKGEVKWYLTSYERDVIQPHALGRFKDLVTATAQSPAMLFYLDNFLSADPEAARRQAAPLQAPQPRGQECRRW
jgi:uncharacterized protein (DUF1800 family)